MQFPAGQAVADADAIGLSHRLDPHLAASTAAFMDGVRHHLDSSFRRKPKSSAREARKAKTGYRLSPGRDKPGHDASSYPPTIPARKTSPIMRSALSAKDRLRGVTSKLDEVAAPAGRTRKFGTRAMPGLRPGPIRIPARSWLKA